MGYQNFSSWTEEKKEFHKKENIHAHSLFKISF
jgi:hypothetical protein